MKITCSTVFSIHTNSPHRDKLICMHTHMHTRWHTFWDTLTQGQTCCNTQRNIYLSLWIIVQCDFIHNIGWLIHYYKPAVVSLLLLSCNNDDDIKITKQRLTRLQHTLNDMDRHNSKSQFFFVMASLSIVLLVNPGPAVYDMIAPQCAPAKPAYRPAMDLHCATLPSQNSGSSRQRVVSRHPEGYWPPPPTPPQARIQSGLQKAAYSGLMQHKHAPCNRLSGSTPATIRIGHTTDWLQKSGDEGGGWSFWLEATLYSVSIAVG